MDNLVDCLENWAQTQPEKTLFRFLDGAGHLREQYTYQQFLERTSALAQHLTEETDLQDGDRVLLVYPPGLEMIVGFFAALNLGVIPVPVSAPTSMASGAGSRIKHVALDCGARVALTTSDYLGGVETAGFLESVRWLATDEVVETGTRLERRRVNPTLFLQYTSGSTGDPKGVIVTHRNVIHNASATLHDFPVGVSWLPQFHDMGLIGHHLFMVVLGGTNHGFSPFDFLKNPALWLQTMSKVRANVTAAPNFAYAYCLREDRVPDASLCDVDLSPMKFMLNAAEPIHAETYARFYERFAKYGLPRDAFIGGFGLAENTIAVTLHGRQTLTVQKERLQRRQLVIQKTTARNNNQLSLVSCGPPVSDLDVRIVDPESFVALGENAIGEIWIDGDSKCAGYWQRPELTQDIFHARIEGEPDNSGSYLRTGDLGFLHEGELFVCGRIKDLIIIHGANYYPQDIEAIVETEFPDISPEGNGRTVAFAHDHDGEERLVVVIEVRNEQDLIDPAVVAQAIRARYFIDPYQVLFVPPRSIAKTTSGKLARSKTRDRWLAGNLKVLASYVHAETSRKEITSLSDLFGHIRELYNLSGEEEDTLADIGLDSLTLVDLTLQIQHDFERRGLGHLVSELDARFLQRLTVVELSRLLEVYETTSDEDVATLRTWLEDRQRSDDAREHKQMLADTQWHPPTDPAEDARDDPQSILMTGGTGFFGPFLLSSLLERTTCAIEVLVRAADSGHGRARIVDALRRTEVWTPEIEEQFESRVSVVCGDLGLRQFGLSDGEWQRLAEEADAIVHNGAVVNYVFSYDVLRAANVEATRELLRLAATTRKKPFHLVSSTFIHGWSSNLIAAEHEYNENLEHLDFGYSQSKCVAEHLVLNAERQGHPVRIYRPTLISASARGVGSKDDIMVRLLAFLIKYEIGVEVLNQISFLPADVVSDHIARMFLLKDTKSSIFHVTTTEYYNMMDVTRSISEQFGYSFNYMSMTGFIEKMNRLCKPDDPLYPLMVFFNRSHDKFKPMENKRYDNRHYRAALEQVRPDIFEPELSYTVANIVKHMQRDGLIPTPALV